MSSCTPPLVWTLVPHSIPRCHDHVKHSLKLFVCHSFAQFLGMHFNPCVSLRPGAPPASHFTLCICLFVIPCTTHLQPFHFLWSADFVTSLHFLRLSLHHHVLLAPLLCWPLVPNCSLSVSVCFPLTPCCVDDQTHPLDRLLTANSLHPINGTSFAHRLIVDVLRFFTRGTCTATAVAVSVTKNCAVQDSRREISKHYRFPVTHGSRLQAPNSPCTIVPKTTRLVLVARVMAPATIFCDCLDNTSCSHSVCVSRSAESSKESSVLQLVSCFCPHCASWSVGTSRQTSPCTDRPVNETRGAILLYGLSLHHRVTCAHTFRCCAHTTSHIIFGDPNCSLLSSRHLIFIVPNVHPAWILWPATSFAVESQPRT